MKELYCAIKETICKSGVRAMIQIYFLNKRGLKCLEVAREDNL